jgi:hypothetical protein
MVDAEQITATTGIHSAEAPETSSARAGTNVEEKELLAGVAEDEQAAPTQNTAASATESSVAAAPKIDVRGDGRFRN